MAPGKFWTDQAEWGMAADGFYEARLDVRHVDGQPAKSLDGRSLAGAVADLVGFADSSELPHNRLHGCPSQVQLHCNIALLQTSRQHSLTQAAFPASCSC